MVGFVMGSSIDVLMLTARLFHCRLLKQRFKIMEEVSERRSVL
jgi:hypothetical protein